MVTLEPIAARHAASLQPLLEDPAIAATTPIPHPYPADGAERLVVESDELRRAGTKYVFAICGDDGAPIGVALLKDVDPAARQGELGYWIGHSFWGRGYATEAGAATLDYAFRTLALEQVIAVCLEDNPASLRVLSKLGFTQVSRFEQSFEKWPAPRTSTRWLLSRDEWRGLARDEREVAP